MAEEPKKISFGFSKIQKKPSIAPQKNEEEKGIQFIDSLEDNSIKLVNGEEGGKNVLIIPLKKANVLRDNMIETLKARKDEKALKQIKNVKDDKNGSVNGIGEDDVEKPLTLDEMAAKEILEDLNKTEDQKDAPTVREIPATNVTSIGEKEPTLENYENTPIQEFGLAVLRGMGWTSESDVGRNGQIIEPENPVLRTKGLGLGADKVLPTKTVSNSGEELVMKKNASLKIVSGPYKNLYGKVEGFDDLPGRLMVRLTLQNCVISISENLIQLVTAAEYNKCSKVLNLDNYNKFYEKKDGILHENQEKCFKSEARRSPSKCEDKETIARKPKKEIRRSVSPHHKAEERYLKLRKVERRNSSSSEPEKGDRKLYKSRNRSSSLDSNTEKRRYRNIRDRSSSSDEHYSNIRKDKKRGSSSSSEKQRRKTKKNKRSSSESSESGEAYKKSMKIKQKKSSSTSFEFEREKRKTKSKREVSENDYKKCRSRKARHSSSSSEEGKYKFRHNSTSDSSDSETEISRSSKFDKKNMKTKHTKKNKHESNLFPEKTSRHKKLSHTHTKNHLRSRSPMNKKKKKKHHRSRS